MPAIKRRMAQPKLEEAGQFNLTPMIDVVFQLLIFFMLITDLAAKQIEPLTLPAASKALKDAKTDDTLLIVNVMGESPKGEYKNGELRVDKRPVTDDGLIKLFRDRKKDTRFLEPGSTKWVKYTMLVRADVTTKWTHVQKVLTMAPIAGGVTRAELGAKAPEGK